MSEETLRLLVRVRRERTLDGGNWVWTALPEGYPGSAGGRTILELQDEMDALKHFITGADEGTEIQVDYVYELPGVTVDLADYRHRRARRDQISAELKQANEDLGAAAREAVAALRAAGITVRDSAALLGLSKSRVEQLSGG